MKPGAALTQKGKREHGRAEGAEAGSNSGSAIGNMQKREVDE
jgi:hypothetical protein